MKFIIVLLFTCNINNYKLNVHGSFEGLWICTQKSGRRDCAHNYFCLQAQSIAFWKEREVKSWLTCLKKKKMMSKNEEKRIFPGLQNGGLSVWWWWWWPGEGCSLKVNRLTKFLPGLPFLKSGGNLQRSSFATWVQLLTFKLPIHYYSVPNREGEAQSPNISLFIYKFLQIMINVKRCGGVPFPWFQVPGSDNKLYGNTFVLRSVHKTYAKYVKLILPKKDNNR